LSDTFESYEEPTAGSFYSEEPIPEVSPLETEQVEVTEEYDAVVERYEAEEEGEAYSSSAYEETPYEQADTYDPTVIAEESHSTATRETPAEERKYAAAEEKAVLRADHEEVAAARSYSASTEAQSEAYLREDNAFDQTLTESD